MKLADLLCDLNQLGIRIGLNGSRLRVDAPAGSLTQELRDGLAEHRDALTVVLNQSNATAAEPIPASTEQLYATDAGPRVTDNPQTGEAIAIQDPVIDPGLLHYGSEGWRANYHLVDTPELFQAFVLLLGRQHRIAIDLETTGLDPRTAKIVGLAFCWRPGEAWYIAIMGPDGETHLKYDETLARLKPILEDPRVVKINQNIKYDINVFRANGIALNGVVGDPMLADYLARAGEHDHKEESLARRHLGYQMIPITELIGKKGGKKKAQLTMDQVSVASVATYAAEDADVAYRLCDVLEPDLLSKGLRTLYDGVEVPLIEVIAEMEYTGIRIDVPQLTRVSEEMGQTLTRLEQEIYGLAGREFNIGSTVQMRKLLFEELRLPQQGRTRGGEPSTDAETLEKLVELGHQLPDKLLEYRSLEKLKGTYLDALPRMTNPVTGRVHTSFNQAVAATGRLSSSTPNLQNIPSRDEQGRRIRQAFLPESGWRLLKSDYSQIELRLLAHWSGDEELQRAYREDRDIHILVASQVNGVAESAVTKEMRTAAKTINFGVIYGMTGRGLARKLKISEVSVY
jgi:DNA polymerase-1